MKGGWEKCANLADKRTKNQSLQPGNLWTITAITPGNGSEGKTWIGSFISPGFGGRPTRPFGWFGTVRGQQGSSLCCPWPVRPLWSVTCRDWALPRNAPPRSLHLGSHRFGIKAARPSHFLQPSIGSQKNAALWRVFAPLQGRR